MIVDLLTRLEKSREAYDEAIKQSERLIITAEKREKKHIEELALLEARRAEEVCIAEELRSKTVEAKTAKEDLRRKVSEIEGKCEAEIRCAEELSTSLTEEVWKHEEELADWTKKLTDCESARTSEIECELKVELGCRRLRKQLDKADMRSQELQRRMEKAEEAYRHLQDETTDGLKLRLEKCLNVEVEIVNELKMNGLKSAKLRMCLRRGLWKKTKMEKSKPRQSLWVNAFSLRINLMRLRAKDLRKKIFRPKMKKSLEATPLEKFVATGGKTITEKPTLPSCQVSSGTVEFDKGEGLLACETKSRKFDVADLLNEPIVLLMKHLDMKMVKYYVPTTSAGSYVELVHRSTKAKAATNAGVTKWIAILTSKCATVTLTL
ncbi:hypothetical protein AXG93_3390s1050 [Marchantia polymorpha subsp. ruderalis]|uniref:Uncharacterized protein n=1 Tax=Marchantia polymorpha subsp. ruderalis TaxID=1480154 RepID=A0A176VR23_MARPO|nr:hypothetical protein AXG93_3390s1050 [Marchantia polymorpha subsp. ruderalis]